MPADIRYAVLITPQELDDAQKAIARANIGAGTGGGGGGPVDLNNAALTGATTAEQISPVAAPMGALAIDVTKARNTKSVTADSTFTFSATPPAGAEFGLRLTGDGTPRAITIPSSYSTSQNATITGFTLPANGTVYLCWEYTGSSYNLTGEPVKAREAICIAASDETTALTTGSGKVTFRMPFDMTLESVRASLTTAQTSGSILTVDVNEGGSSVLSTKLTLDNTEKTSTTAATPAVISDAALANDAEITVDIDQVGDGTAKGLKVWLIGSRS